MQRTTLLLGLAAALVVGALALLLTGPGAEPTTSAGGPAAETAGPSDAASASLASVSDEGVAAGAAATRASADAPATAREAITAQAQASEVESSGPFLIGRVVDPAGRGIPNAELRFSNGADIDGPRAIRLIGAVVSRSKSGTTDDQGHFRIEDPGLDAVAIDIEADGYQPLEIEDYELPKGGGDRYLDNLILAPGVVLEGRVVDTSGKPVAEAELALVDARRGFVFEVGEEATPDAVTGPDGAFSIDRLAPGEWSLQVLAEGYPMRVFKGSAAEAGLQPVLTLEIPIGAKIRGYAVGYPEGRHADYEVAAFPVEAMDFMRFASAGQATAKLDAEGRFEIAGLDPDRMFRVELTEPRSGGFAFMGGGAKRSQSVETAAGVDEVELAFLEPASVRFKVVDEQSGAPVERFEASLGLAFNQRKLEDESGEPISFHAGGEARFGGLFEEDFEIFDRSSPRLKVNAAGYADLSFDVEGLENGVDLDLGEIRITPAPPVVVVVRDARDGDPIENATVDLRPAEIDGEWFEMLEAQGQRRRAKTGPNGRAEVTSYPGVLSILEVRKGGRAPFVKTDVLVERSPLELEVELGPGGDVVVRVVDDTGTSIGGITVEHRGPGETETRGTRSTSSRRGAKFRNLEPGEHSFRVSEGDDGRRWRRPNRGDEEEPWTLARVVHDGETELTLRVESTRAAYGLVRSRGRALAGAEVTASRLPEERGEREEALDRMQVSGGGNWRDPSATTDGAGEWRVDGLESGWYAAIVEHESRSMREVVPFEVRGAEVRVDIDLSTTVVRGRVVDRDGVPVAGVEVRAGAPGQGSRSRRGQDWNPFVAMGVDVVEVGGGAAAAPEEGTTGADGTFELEGLPAGVELAVNASGRFVQPDESEPFWLEADEVRDGIELVVSPAGALRVVSEAADEEATYRFVNVTATYLGELEEGQPPL
ncbi:MAG: carboxypeptidase-like regulatory domain-containing protein, partial [Planctomycetota bacterium]